MRVPCTLIAINIVQRFLPYQAEQTLEVLEAFRAAANLVSNEKKKVSKREELNVQRGDKSMGPLVYLKRNVDV